MKMQRKNLSQITGGNSMKKFAIIAMALMVALAVTACSNNTQNSSSSTPAARLSSPALRRAAPKRSPAPKPRKYPAIWMRISPSLPRVRKMSLRKRFLPIR